MRQRFNGVGCGCKPSKAPPETHVLVPKDGSILMLRIPAYFRDWVGVRCPGWLHAGSASLCGWIVPWVLTGSVSLSGWIVSQMLIGCRLICLLGCGALQFDLTSHMWRTAGRFSFSEVENRRLILLLVHGKLYVDLASRFVADDLLR